MPSGRSSEFLVVVKGTGDNDINGDINIWNKTGLLVSEGTVLRIHLHTPVLLPSQEITAQVFLVMEMGVTIDDLFIPINNIVLIKKMRGKGRNTE